MKSIISRTNHVPKLLQGLCLATFLVVLSPITNIIKPAKASIPITNLQLPITDYQSTNYQSAFNNLQSPISNLQSDVTLRATAGLDGYCKVDHWFPVQITMENNGPGLEGSVEVTLQDRLHASWIYSKAVTLPEVSRKEVTLMALPEWSIREVIISLISDGRPVSQITVPIMCLNSKDVVFGVLAANPSIFNVLRNLGPPNGRKASLAQISMSDFTEYAQGFDMLDAILISDVDTGGLTQPQQGAVMDWVSNGGRLVITGGPSWQKTATGLPKLLPLHPNGTSNLSNLNALGRFTPNQDDLEGNTVVATGAIDKNADVVADQNGVPLIARKRLGYGEVYYLTADPALAPLHNWNGAEDLYRALLTTPFDIPTWSSGFINWDNATDALANIPGLSLPSISLICGILGLYVFALGPLNYLVLHRLKRRELAWLTIPVLVLLFSGAAFLVGIRLRGNHPVINELSIVQVWPDSVQAKVNGLVGIFSPRRRSYQLEIGGRFLSHPIPGRFADSTNLKLQQSDHGVNISDLRIDVGDIESVAVEGQIHAPVFTHNLSLNLNGPTPYIEGTIYNNSQITLEDAMILAPGHAQNLGVLLPGDSKPVQFIISAPYSNSSGNPNSNPDNTPDDTLEDIFGTSLYRNFEDNEIFRRSKLVQAAFGTKGSRGGGLYLIGWADQSPLDVVLIESRSITEQTTLYVFALNPTVIPSGDQITLPPALFTWSVIEDTSTHEPATPYATFLEPGNLSLRYNLIQPVPFNRVETLTLHIKTYFDTGPTGLNISSWDFKEHRWQALPPLAWGDYDIPEPSRFVGANGEIRLLLENQSSETFIHIRTADFTLVVNQ